ncbi:F-type H+-transporting ATPase subunit alpha [Mycoplasma testudineum]|uniref:F-type H+-transporting ATPase subunit alpha n=1 Tax=Mycoplasma testudineum TaxID=244584 RepID=A0A4R6IDX6_9MOLU|nr:ATP F0F1 synthase subunit alpha [Mycoplasma testudineum]OYD26688.1 ATP F0F1 synthase subunit alpha [Mycoplasma testudineum]TDO19817.1 F-type H+-transporting ATPase subunit alpha [Mycoplasma testudineum]
MYKDKDNILYKEFNAHASNKSSTLKQNFNKNVNDHVSKKSSSQNLYIESIKDYIVKIRGKYPFRFGQIFHLGQQNVEGILIRATEESAFLLVNQTHISSIKAGDIAKNFLQAFEVETRKNFYNSIIDIEGNKIYSEHDSKFGDDVVYKHRSQIFNIAANMMERVDLNEPLETGIFTIDVLIPIGKGQRELIVGDAKSGKTSIALTTIINQKNNDIRIVYVAIGTKLNDLKVIYKTLAEHDLMKKVIIIYASSDNAYEQYLAPYVGMTHAENIRESGKDVLIIFDDLTNHANILRESALLINKPVGKEAFPGDLFYSHSSLLERAGKFATGGTITALPIIKILNNDITSLLSTNVISITDGQIVLNSELKSNGIMPAIDINKSVSRTGSKVQSKVLSKISSNILKIYTQYEHNSGFAGSSYDFSDAIKEIISKGQALFSVLKQDEYRIYSRAFILILAYIIEWRILEQKLNANELVRFIHYVLHNTLTGQAIIKAVSQTKNNIDETLLKFYITDLLKQYEKLKQDSKMFDFDKQTFSITPKQWQKIKETLWTEK